MIRMIQSKSAQQAKSYFTEALQKADYYINDQELKGEFKGHLAGMVGLHSEPTKEAFYALCENVHPVTGKPLTPRTNDERTVGYDINFHCPKSVSLVHVLSNDTDILNAFKESVSETMRAIENDSMTRVRKNGEVGERHTGNLAWAEFIHQTARPVDDYAPDPHLHAHCFVFNMTHDKEENQIKACQFRDIKRDMPFYQSLFHKHLSDKLIERGYQVRKTAKSFEIVGVPPEAIELFSKRTDLIGRVAKEKGITSAKELADLGARTRAKKQSGLSMSELQGIWRAQIKDAGLGAGFKADTIIKHAIIKEGHQLTPHECINHALQHSFERASVMPSRRILQEAYRHSIGNANVSTEAINLQFAVDNRIIHLREYRQDICTIKEVLSEEREMIALARAGIGAVKPLYQAAPKLALKGQQADAVSHVLTTTSRVSIIRGAAGSGKTTLMTEAVEKIKKAGKDVTVVAPTTQAALNVLRNEGFPEAQTVAALLVNKSMQEKLRGQVLWVDEAGLLGTSDMKKLLEITTKQKARLILGGDTRQHTSVVRGDALRILNKVGGIRSAEVSKIYRQKNIAYKQAVESLSLGLISEGFERMDAMGAIKEIDPLKPHETLVKDYIKAVKDGKSALIVSPTHQHGNEVTDAIRKELRGLGLLGKKELQCNRFENLNFTVSEKSDWRNFSVGQVVQFNQNTKGIKRGSTWSVHQVEDGQICIKTGSRILPLALDNSAAFDVMAVKPMALSKGDKVRITRNSFDKNEKRMNNGQLLTVKTVHKSGQVTLVNAKSKVVYSIDTEFGHIAHAHCITSHAAQGKTVDEVFIAQPAATFPGTDAKQFYVSVSRGRDWAHIYTDDKETLHDYARRTGDRLSAVEVSSGGAIHSTHQRIRHKEMQERPFAEKADRSEKTVIDLDKDKDDGPRP